MAQGKKGRKFDRNRKRSASMGRYTAEKRWMYNKKRRLDRLARQALRKAKRKTTPRGAARRKRRLGKQPTA